MFIIRINKSEILSFSMPLKRSSTKMIQNSSGAFSSKTPDGKCKGITRVQYTTQSGHLEHRLQILHLHDRSRLVHPGTQVGTLQELQFSLRRNHPHGHRYFYNLPYHHQIVACHPLSEDRGEVCLLPLAYLRDVQTSSK